MIRVQPYRLAQRRLGLVRAAEIDQRGTQKIGPFRVLRVEADGFAQRRFQFLQPAKLAQHHRLQAMRRGVVRAQGCQPAKAGFRIAEIACRMEQKRHVGAGIGVERVDPQRLAIAGQRLLEPLEIGQRGGEVELCHGIVGRQQYRDMEGGARFLGMPRDRAAPAPD